MDEGGQDEAGRPGRGSGRGRGESQRTRREVTKSEPTADSRTRCLVCEWKEGQQRARHGQESTRLTLSNFATLFAAQAPHARKTTLRAEVSQLSISAPHRSLNPPVTLRSDFTTPTVLSHQVHHLVRELFPAELRVTASVVRSNSE